MSRGSFSKKKGNTRIQLPREVDHGPSPSAVSSSSTNRAKRLLPFLVSRRWVRSICFTLGHRILSCSSLIWEELHPTRLALCNKTDVSQVKPRGLLQAC
ncbi:hypothetical protein EYF80_011164 [Liparis tanakae]|uniref:Uncharacterized protein n=1 Tax=Liparis tanakae TaxID=230148 RepID=A0A4Z2IKN0_9TELE|nr:hypothetical protein EYF80_011164 [Liparis tanakae]